MPPGRDALLGQGHGAADGAMPALRKPARGAARRPARIRRFRMPSGRDSFRFRGLAFAAGARFCAGLGAGGFPGAALPGMTRGRDGPAHFIAVAKDAYPHLLPITGAAGRDSYRPAAGIGMINAKNGIGAFRPAKAAFSASDALICAGGRLYYAFLPAMGAGAFLRRNTAEKQRNQE